MQVELRDQFRYLVGGYYGVTYMDEYPLKVYVLKDIENYIRDFVTVNPIDNFDYIKEAKEVEEKVSTITKLQDSLIVLQKMNASMELVLLVKARIKKMTKK